MSAEEIELIKKLNENIKNLVSQMESESYLKRYPFSQDRIDYEKLKTIIVEAIKETK